MTNYGDIAMGIAGAFTQNRNASKATGQAQAAQQAWYDWASDNYNRLQSQTAAEAAAGGGGGGGNPDAARLNALRRAAGQLRESSGKAQRALRPYMNVGKKMLPQMAQAYAGGLANLGALGQFVGGQDQMGKLTANTNPLEQAAPLPSWYNK